MVRRTLNWKLLIATFVAAAALGGALLAAHRWQVSRTAGIFLDYADQQEKALQWLKAAGYIERYLALYPADAAARARLAEVFAKGAVSPAQKQRAVDFCYRAITAGAKEKENALRERLAELLLELGRFKEAEREAKVLVDGAGKGQPVPAIPARVLALALWGQLGEGSLAGIAATEFDIDEKVQLARQLNPADVELAVVEAQLYRKHSALLIAKYQELNKQLTKLDCDHKADESLDSLIAARPDDPRAYLVRHLYRVEYGRPDPGSDLQAAIRLGPELPEVLLTAGAFHYRRAIEEREKSADSEKARRLLEQSKAYYERAILKLAGDPRLASAYLALGESATALGNANEAIDYWREGAEQVESPIGRAQLLGRAADALLAANRNAEAEKLLVDVEKTLNLLDASISGADLLTIQRAQNLRRAMHHARSGRAVEAVTLLRQIFVSQAQRDAEDQATVAAYRLLGDVSASAGQWLEAASAYDQAATLRPRDHATRLAAANAWLMAGRPGMAAEAAERTVIDSPSLTGWLLLATAELQRQAALPPGERSWLRLTQALAALENRPPNVSFTAAWRVALIRADYELLLGRQNGQEKQAIDKVAPLLRQVEQEHFSAPDCPLQLIQFYEHLGLREDADRALARLHDPAFAPATTAIASARVLARRGEAAQAASVLDEALGAATPEQQASLRKEAVQIAISAQDYSRAEMLLNVAHQASPRDVAVLKQLADLDITRGNARSLETWAQKLERAGPWGEPLVHYVRAYALLLSSSGDDEAALQSALAEQSRAVALRPDWAEAYVLRGMIDRRLGRLESAVTAYQWAIQLGIQRIGVYEELIALLDRLNRPADCNRYLSQLAYQLSLSQRLTELAGSHEIRQDQPERAVEIAQQRVDKHPRDPVSRLWLGRVLLLTRRNAEAREQLEQAVRLAPEDARMWSGLFTFYLHTNDRERALETLGELAKQARLEPAQRSYVLAQGHEMLGDFDAASRHYQAAAEALPESADVQLRMAAHFLRRDAQRAEACLRRALALDPSSEVARRTLALLLASRGGEENLRQAELLLGDLQDRRLAVEDRRLHAVFLFQRQDKESLERAAQIMEQVVRENASQAGDRLILSHLYQRLSKLEPEKDAVAARHESARQQLLMVAARTGAEPGHVMALIEFLLKPAPADQELAPERRAEAGVWLDKLEKIITQRALADRDAIERLVQLRQRHGSYDRCAPWLDRLEILDKDPLRALALRAKLMADQLGSDQAEALIESRAAALLSGASNPRERQTTLRNVANLYAQAGNFAAAERWHRQAFEEDPAEFQGLAMVLARQGRLDESLELCERAAEREQTHVPALVMAAALVESAPQAEHFRRAEPTISAALGKFKTEADLLYAVAVLRIVEQRYDAAASLLRRTLEMQPKHVDAMNNLALLLAENPQHLEAARELIDKAIDVAGTRPGLLDTKGAILVYDGKSDAAVSILERARDLDADPRHSFHLALAYREIGEIEKARFELRAALDGQLEAQVLTPNDRRLLSDMKSLLTPWPKRP